MTSTAAAFIKSSARRSFGFSKPYLSLNLIHFIHVNRPLSRTQMGMRTCGIPGRRCGLRSRTVEAGGLVVQSCARIRICFVARLVTLLLFLNLSRTYLEFAIGDDVKNYDGSD